jgi:hypothetical protein
MNLRELLTQKYFVKDKNGVTFEVFTAVGMKNAVFWDVAVCLLY